MTIPIHELIIINTVRGNFFTESISNTEKNLYVINVIKTVGNATIVATYKTSDVFTAQNRQGQATRNRTFIINTIGITIVN